MKINNSLDVARWENLPCKCNHDDIEQCYPISNCEHCRCKECWDSVPQKNFTVNTFDKETGDVNGIKTVNKITLIRGKKFQDVIGWEF